ncbi:uncharacterized protein BX664DRAFT_323593 [Halteromyces radiatus]|uniref:uncharacterized protein n=1 Tax=Halteromyces radiatus TaxID=101107 RepID=UPI00221F119D|nr:uncharacterized protein BX664DRAFT_323593 [Halteromyces radiatus]KAI8096305.1 hypothetical protein BX664DRAFT_323593 [Halteromyces radiatus]
MAVEEKKVFEDFKTYNWLEDTVFQSGLNNLLRSMETTTNKQSIITPLDEAYQQHQQDNQNTLQLLRAKHFYYSKFKHSFDLEKYLEYELEQVKLENGAKYQRLEEYNFDQDEKYIKGLPKIIEGWVQEQVSGSKPKKLWDKTHFDTEFIKVKAFYYSACVESIDVKDYLTWKYNKEQKNEPTCPFANLWQNKGKADLGPQIISDEFLSVEPPKFTGPTIVTFASPRSRNMLTEARLNELNEELTSALSNNKTTSILLTATVAEKSNDSIMTTNDRIETNDTKVISSGLAYEATYQALKNNNNNNDNIIDQLAPALDYLGTTYYNYVRHQHLHIDQQQQQPMSIITKPTFTFMNGQIPLNAAYLTLWHGYLRIGTEHCLLDCHLTLSHAPIPPLLLFQLCDMRNKSSNKLPLPIGWDFYLALAPPDFGRLRAPELLRLGLLDIFVPETKLSDAFSNAKRMALCPSPSTSTAVQLALALDHSYPGPERISTWQKEISDCFDASSLGHIISRLKLLDTVWSQKILTHWYTLPPILLKVIFKAVQKARNMSPLNVINMEENLNKKWRQSSDYQQFLRGETSWQGSLNDDDDDQDIVSSYFDDIDDNDSRVVPFVYKVSEKDMIDQIDLMRMNVCPVTGQRSNNGCPVLAGQQQNPDDDDVCPVTGQRNNSNDNNNNDDDGGCPFSTELVNKKNEDASNLKTLVCPVTGQSDGICPGSQS